MNRPTSSPRRPPLSTPSPSSTSTSTSRPNPSATSSSSSSRASDGSSSSTSASSSGRSTGLSSLIAACPSASSSYVAGAVGSRPQRPLPPAQAHARGSLVHWATPRTSTVSAGARRYDDG